MANASQAGHGRKTESAVVRMVQGEMWLIAGEEVVPFFFFFFFSVPSPLLPCSARLPLVPFPCVCRRPFSFVHTLYLTRQTSTPTPR